MSADEQGYNGWSNYETWCVALWLSNDEGHYLNTRSMAAHARSRRELADELDAYVDSLPEVEAVDSTASFVSDLLGRALGRVDYREIADNLLSEVAEV